MLKAWSITTTVRNPERLRDFLVALKPLENKTWDNANQENYQKLLIKNRLYGFGNAQFYNGLTADIVKMINDTDSEINDNTVDEIIRLKNYTEFAMRGRQSINPLTKFGFVIIDNGIVKITELGKKLIASEKDAGDVFLKSFIKWQIPNPASNDFPDDGDYDVVPFVATLKLISEVNRIEAGKGNNAVGISKREFSLFVPSLVKYADIEKYAEEIVKLRTLQKGKKKQERKEIRDNYRKQFATNFLGTSKQTAIDKLLQNLRDYGDNAIRYFRLTKFIRIRGNGFYIDLEPNRRIEIEALFESEFYKPKHFADRNEYVSYMSDDNLPVLPWQTKDKLSKIASDVYKDVIELQSNLGLAVESKKEISAMSENDLVLYVNDLRETRKELQEKDNHIKSQPVSSITQYIEQLEGIFEFENRALMLEYLSTMGLHALNDAKEIKPNYPVGDDNEPTSTAPGGMADIECFYDNFNMICEVTMLNGRDQWFNEGQPVMRHLRDFENSHDNAYCIFIAPKIHTDSAETFHIANTVGYKGSKQKIAPLTIKQFVELLKTLKKIREANKNFTHNSLKILINDIADSANSISNSDDWVANTQNIVNSWAISLVSA
ncbi:MAG: AlwI family type II restriction endonuclease [Candidatus Moraniibacteriota bacterium]|nr:MAG: AlwI family type II restriction endonuclease [Candidatus Moranbacteria bacterium]